MRIRILPGAPFRHFHDLKKGGAPVTASPDIIANMTLDMVFAYMGIQLNADRVAGKKMALNFAFSDTKQKYAVYLGRSVLNAWPDYQEDKADTTVTLDRATLKERVSTSALEQRGHRGPLGASGSRVTTCSITRSTTTRGAGTTVA